jgi:hypothetical protein
MPSANNPSPPRFGGKIIIEKRNIPFVSDAFFFPEYSWAINKNSIKTVST